MKAEWKFAETTHGELCVMTSGETMMLAWFVLSWDMLEKVNGESDFLCISLMVHEWYIMLL